MTKYAIPEGISLKNIDYDSLVDPDDYQRYPTDYALDVISSFRGTPHQLVDLIKSLWYMPDCIVVRAPWRGEIEVRFITVGWSGNESLISALSRTVFNMMWWDSDHRGGLHVYKVRQSAWDEETYLGKFA